MSKFFLVISNLFQLYEDDGNSESYKQGEFHLTTLKWTWGDDPVFSIEQTPDQPNYIPANRQISLLFHCLDLNDVPEINSDTNLEISSEIVAPNHSVKILYPVERLIEREDHIPSSCNSKEKCP